MDILDLLDGLIVTNGYKTGVVQLIGQAIDKVRLKQSRKKLTAIGISKWGCIKNVEKMILGKKHNINTVRKNLVLINLIFILVYRGALN